LDVAATLQGAVTTPNNRRGDSDSPLDNKAERTLNVSSSFVSTIKLSQLAWSLAPAADFSLVLRLSLHVALGRVRHRDEFPPLGYLLLVLDDYTAAAPARNAAVVCGVAPDAVLLADFLALHHGPAGEKRVG